jgi:hypothetical protein
VAEGDGDLSDAGQEQHIAVALHGLSSLPPLLSSIRIQYGLIFRSAAACSSGGDGSGQGEEATNTDRVKSNPIARAQIQPKNKAESDGPCSRPSFHSAHWVHGLFGRSSLIPTLSR